MHPPPPPHPPTLYRWYMEKIKNHIPVSVQVCEEVNSDSIMLMKSFLTGSDSNKGKCIKGIQGRRAVEKTDQSVSDTEENKQQEKKRKDEAGTQLSDVECSENECVSFVSIIYSDFSFKEHQLTSRYTQKHKHT